MVASNSVSGFFNCNILSSGTAFFSTPALADSSFSTLRVCVYEWLQSYCLSLSSSLFWESSLNTFTFSKYYSYVRFSDFIVLSLCLAGIQNIAGLLLYNYEYFYNHTMFEGNLKVSSNGLAVFNFSLDH